MSVELTKTPDRLINNDPLMRSYWNAVHNPINFSFKREDYQIEIITIAGQIHATFVGGFVGDVSILFDVGDELYINTSGPQPATGNFIVDVFVGTDVIVFESDPAFLNAFAVGYLNDSTKKNYFLQVEIWERTQNVIVYDYLSTIEVRPTIEGDAKIDVSSFLKSLAFQQNEYDFFANESAGQSGLGGGFSIIFKEIWNDQTVVPTTSLLNIDDWFWVDSVLQIGAKYGGNMGEYVPFQVSTAPLMLFMTSFKTPTIFSNYPFAMTFIYGFEAVSQLNSFQEFFDINGVSIGTHNAITEPDKPLVHQVEFHDNPAILNAVKLEVRFGNGGQWSSETKTLLIDRSCKDSPIFITWQNQLGGWDYWLFDKLNSTKAKTKNKNPYLQNIDNIQIAKGNTGITGKDISKEITVGARIRADQMDGMESLFGSAKVQLMVEEWQGLGYQPVWRNVIIKAGSLLVNESEKSFYDIKFKIELPKIYTQNE